jgi:hypothetical protein
VVLLEVLGVVMQVIQDHHKVIQELRHQELQAKETGGIDQWLRGGGLADIPGLVLIGKWLLEEMEGHFQQVGHPLLMLVEVEDLPPAPAAGPRRWR